MEYIEKMEKITGKKFGDHENPLLVSVRSGARASMPGMMDTILNLGLNEDVVDVIAKKSNNPRWAWDCYRRFIQMYSDVVMEVGKKYFEQLIDAMKAKKGVTQDVELDAADLKELAMQFKAEYKAKIGEEFPTDPKEQLVGAIKAVFRSWDNPRANFVPAGTFNEKLPATSVTAPVFVPTTLIDAPMIGSPSSWSIYFPRTYMYLKSRNTC